MKATNGFLKSSLQYLGRLICPPHCICCDEPFGIDDDKALCPKCTEEILSRIGIFHTSYDNVDKAYSLLPYDCWYARKLIAHSKYISSRSFLTMIGNMYKDLLFEHNLLNQIDVITFSPRRPSQIRLYGFDQSAEMAKALSEITKIPYSPLLKRRGFSKAQKKLHAEKRKTNTSGKFRPIGDNKGKTILLIDDVVTTGFTTNECARILKENGAEHIYVLSIARK